MQHISITGDLGSGKSTVAKLLCEKLNMQYMSTGVLQRNLAAQKGMDTLEFNKYANSNKEVDEYIDGELKAINNAAAPHIIDARLGWFFVKKSYKIYLMAADEVAARRVLADQLRTGEPEGASVHTKVLQLRERRTLENERFFKTYGVSYSIFQDFDLVLDTTSAGIQEVVDAIVNSFESRAQQQGCKILLAPIRVLPTPSNYNFEALDNTLPICCFLHHQFYLCNAHTSLSNCLVADDPLMQVAITNATTEFISAIQQPNYNEVLTAWQEKFGITFYNG